MGRYELGKLGAKQRGADMSGNRTFGDSRHLAICSRMTIYPYRDCPESEMPESTGRAVGAVSIGSFEVSR